MQIIKSALKGDKEYSGLLKCFLGELGKSGERLPVCASGFCEGFFEAFAASLAEDTAAARGGIPGLFIITGDEKSALSLQNSLLSFFPRVLYYPKKDLVFMGMGGGTAGSRVSNPFEHLRLGVLRKIIDGDFDVVVTTPEAALQLTAPGEIIADNSVRLRLGASLPAACGIKKLSEFFEYLAALGYERAETVESTGKFSARGGIIDIFPPSSDFPVRFELFGDEIDAMGYFDPVSQRRTENIKEFEIIPCTECIIDRPARERCVSYCERLLKNKGLSEEARARLGFELDTLRAGEALGSRDRYISQIYPSPATLFDYAGKKTSILIIHESAKVRDTLAAADFINAETVLDMLQGGYTDSKNCTWQLSAPDFELIRGDYATVVADSFAAGTQGRIAGLFSFTARQSPHITEGFGAIADDVASYIAAGSRILVLLDSDSGIRSFAETMNDLSLPCLAAAEDKYAGWDALPEGVVIAVKTPKRLFAGSQMICGVAGFELPKQQFVLVTDSMADRRRAADRVRRSAGGRDKSGRVRIMSYTDLSVGDYVVHKSHGIGIFAGIERLDVSGGVQKDFIKIKYSGADVLFVPCNQLDMVSKFIGAGSEEGTVRLSKMGTSAWSKTKARAKAAARDIARELIRLYASRLAEKGYPFSPDTEWQRDFESLFEYTETDDQLICARQIKDDMERPVPMDRLLCGDVGFGKTEVALRAVFKCVSESKQAAILVPTTILAWQHYRTIVSRFREFPVKVELLSRFKTKKEQDDTIKRLKSGETDIIVGTHRIIQKDMKFHDLGLLVVDEEQRFGVAHKEKIKQLAKSVDVLTLTATPIPRTLNMALSGIRDMSVIEEAPQNRIPVQTFVFEYDETVVAEAIKTELRRGGQVFYLYNRVETIESKAARVRELSGGARVGVAHGQMDEETLSRVWGEMVDGTIDVLVCTTIIESGVDVPDANTLIIENSDRLGLSQLHQIRGRVGRSNRRAYAYLTYPKHKSLSEIAEKRLRAMRDYTEFGAGFKIAMRDLEIRGAGNILGAEQHGQMDAVGYDLYIKILERAVNQEKEKFERARLLGTDGDDGQDDGLPAPDGEDNGAQPKAKPKKYGTKVFLKDSPAEAGESGQDADAELEPTECLVDVAVDAFIPGRYIESELVRIEIYKRIAAIENKADAEDLADELVDRFGDIPMPVKNLIDIAGIRNTACTQFIDTIENKDKKAVIMFISALAGRHGVPLLERWTKAAARLPGRLLISLGDKPHITYTLKKDESILDAMKQVFAALAEE